MSNDFSVAHEIAAIEAKRTGPPVLPLPEVLKLFTESFRRFCESAPQWESGYLYCEYWETRLREPMDVLGEIALATMRDITAPVYARIKARSFINDLFGYFRGPDREATKQTDMETAQALDTKATECLIAILKDPSESPDMKNAVIDMSHKWLSAKIDSLLEEGIIGASNIPSWRQVTVRKDPEALARLANRFKLSDVVNILANSGQHEENVLLCAVKISPVIARWRPMAASQIESQVRPYLASSLHIIWEGKEKKVDIMVADHAIKSYCGLLEAAIDRGEVTKELAEGAQLGAELCKNREVDYQRIKNLIKEMKTSLR
jgi:hypothetical protein